MADRAGLSVKPTTRLGYFDELTTPNDVDRPSSRSMEIERLAYDTPSSRKHLVHALSCLTARSRVDDSDFRVSDEGRFVFLQLYRQCNSRNILTLELKLHVSIILITLNFIH